MNKKVLNYIEKCEGWKVGIKNLHWSANNMSQHELCDDIASDISDFEDLVSEVEQSISGKIKLNGFTPKSYKIDSLKTFVEDVISDSQAFLKELEKMGEKYIGIKSECETFIGTMQRKLYLVNFTLKEELKRRLRAKMNEGFRREENIKTIFHGTKPSTEGGVFKRINDLTKNGQLNTRTFNGVDDAFDFYSKILGNLGEFSVIEPNESTHVVKLDTENGKTYYGLMRIKGTEEGKCKASITFSPHSDEMENPDPETSAPTLEDDIDMENNEGGAVYEMYEDDLKELVRESVNVLLEKSNIEIKPSKKGTFTAAATKHGKSVQAFASEVLNNKDKYSSKMVKKANFARNFGKKK